LGTVQDLALGALHRLLFGFWHMQLTLHGVKAAVARFPHCTWRALQPMRAPLGASKPQHLLESCNGCNFNT